MRKLLSSVSKSKLCYDWRSTGQSVLEQSTHLGLTTRYLLTVWQLRSCSCGAPSLTRGWVCLLYMLLALVSAVFLGPSPLGLETIFYCLRFETSFSSPRTTRRVAVEVFDPASTRVSLLRFLIYSPLNAHVCSRWWVIFPPVVLAEYTSKRFTVTPLWCYTCQSSTLCIVCFVTKANMQTS
jgi:hypothetical protein